MTLANSYTYGTWGSPTTATHNGIADLGFRFLYAGRYGVEWDDWSGINLHYMQSRHYKHGFGRFLQPDPSGAEPNWYAYAANSPVTMVDPDGTFAWLMNKDGWRHRSISCRTWRSISVSQGRACRKLDRISANYKPPTVFEVLEFGTMLFGPGRAILGRVGGWAARAAQRAFTRVSYSRLNNNRWVRIGYGKIPSAITGRGARREPRISVGAEGRRIDWHIQRRTIWHPRQWPTKHRRL